MYGQIVTQGDALDEFLSGVGPIVFLVGLAFVLGFVGLTVRLVIKWSKSW